MAEAGSLERKVSFCHRATTRPPDQRPPHSRVEDEPAVERRYTIGRELGRGSFGIVREATSRLMGELLAVKLVNKDKPGSTSIQMLTREVEVLKRLDHPHIIKLEEILETPQKMYLVMELCTGGELTTRLKLLGYFREPEAKEVMRQLTDVLTYLHSNDIVHRDLKLENVLLKSPVNSPNDKLDIRVTDFGLAYMKSLSDLEDPIMDERCGTPYYMAPEVILSRHQYTEMCDVWSLGVIMYYLLCGKLPFHGEAGMKLEECIIDGHLTFREVEWIDISEQAQTLIRGMLCKDTTRRLTALRVLNDAWFTGQQEKFLNAIQLMEAMTTDAKSDEMPPQPHTPAEQPPVKKISTASPSQHQPQRHFSTMPRSQHHRQHHHSPEKPSLLEKRFRSTSTLTPNAPSAASPSHGQLKNTSTSSLHSRSPGRQRSVSVGQRPSSSTSSRRTSQQPIHEHSEHHYHHHQQQQTPNHRQRKHSSHSGSKT